MFKNSLEFDHDQFPKIKLEVKNILRSELSLKVLEWTKLSSKHFYN